MCENSFYTDDTYSLEMYNKWNLPKTLVLY